MDYWDVAGQAIEDMVADKHPRDSENWSAIVPMDVEKGWGLELGRWSTEARIIVDKFNAAIGRDVSVPNGAIVTAGNKALDEFQAYLVAKVNVASVRLAYHQTKMVLASWGE